MAGPFAKRMTLRLLSSEKQPIFITLCIAALTVSLMCPMMSAVATVWFKHPGAQFPAVWLQTVALNFPMAFFWHFSAYILGAKSSGKGTAFTERLFVCRAG